MRRGELFAYNIEDKPFDFGFYSDKDNDTFPVEWLFDDKNLPDVNSICTKYERFNAKREKVKKFEVHPRFRMCIISTCANEDLQSVLDQIPNIDKWHKMRICV